MDMSQKLLYEILEWKDFSLILLGKFAKMYIIIKCAGYDRALIVYVPFHKNVPVPI